VQPDDMVSVCEVIWTANDTAVIAIAAEELNAHPDSEQCITVEIRNVSRIVIK
jgi:hypothetical protein